MPCLAYWSHLPQLEPTAQGISPFSQPKRGTHWWAPRFWTQPEVCRHQAGRLWELWFQGGHQYFPLT